LSDAQPEIGVVPERGVVAPVDDGDGGLVVAQEQPVTRTDVTELKVQDSPVAAPSVESPPQPDVVPEPVPQAEVAVTESADAMKSDKPAAKPAAPVASGTVQGGNDLRAAAESASDASPKESEAGVARAEPMADGAVGYFVGDEADAQMQPIEPNTEKFANDAPNPVKIASVEPVSTFSIDVDTASYSVVRSSLMGGWLPDPASVRIEEMVNYFPYAYAAPDGDKAFRTTVSVMQTPWNADTELVHIAIQGKLPVVEDRPPLNLVFLIDTSGSMEDTNKLPLLKQSFRLMVNELRPEDKVAIVTYAGSAGLVLEPTEAANKVAILAALDNLSAGGSTAGQAGLQQAYAVAEEMAGEGSVNRILLATDGDFNVGISDPDELKTFIGKKRESGTYLSVLGFGRGNLDDATMQSLAQNGNGTAAYIDTLSEAQKVLVDQLTGALFPIANDVKIQIEWNPALVAEYRLIGYETRALAREDFNNDKVDAGEIGAGHTVTAIYEITPVGSPAILNDELRYQPAATNDPAQEAELGFLRLRHKAPGEDASVLEETPIPMGVHEAGVEARFGVAIAGFGQLLQGSKYMKGWTYADAIALANGAKGEDPYGYRAEAVTLMRLADTLSK